MLLYLWLSHVNNIYLILHCGEINAVCGDGCSVVRNIDYNNNNNNNITNSGRIIISLYRRRRHRPRRHAKIYILIDQLYNSFTHATRKL